MKKSDDYLLANQKVKVMWASYGKSRGMQVLNEHKINIDEPKIMQAIII